MFCPNCGNTISDGSPFCPVCGFPLDRAAAAPAAGKKPSRKERKAAKKAAKKARGKRPWSFHLLRVLAVLVLLLTAGAAVWHFLGPRPEDRNFPYSRWELSQAAAVERSSPPPCAIDGTNGRVSINEGVVGSNLARVGDVIMEARDQGVSDEDDLTLTGYIEVNLLSEEHGIGDPLRSRYIDGCYGCLTPFAGKVWCAELTVSADGSDLLFSLVKIDPTTLEKTAGYVPEDGWEFRGGFSPANGKLWFGLRNRDTDENWVCHLEPGGDMVWDFALDERYSFLTATKRGIYVSEWREDYTSSVSLFNFYGDPMDILPRGDFSTDLLAETSDGIYLIESDNGDRSLVRVDPSSGYVVDLTDSLTAQGVDLYDIDNHNCDTDGHAFYLLSEDYNGTDLYRIDDGSLAVSHMFRDNHDVENHISSLYLLGTTHCLIEYTFDEDVGGTVTSIHPLTG